MTRQQDRIAWAALIVALALAVTLAFVPWENWL